MLLFLRFGPDMSLFFFIYSFLESKKKKKRKKTENQNQKKKKIKKKPKPKPKKKDTKGDKQVLSMVELSHRHQDPSCKEGTNRLL